MRACAHGHRSGRGAVRAVGRVMTSVDWYSGACETRSSACGWVGGVIVCGVCCHSGMREWLMKRDSCGYRNGVDGDACVVLARKSC